MRGTSNLDRIYVSELNYVNVKVIMSATTRLSSLTTGRTSQPTTNDENAVFRKRSPTQHALFLEHISQAWIELQSDADAQSNFDDMYAIMKNLLDRFYLEQQITVSSTDPRFVTPAIKAILRRKNRLMQACRTKEASALAHGRT